MAQQNPLPPVGLCTLAQLSNPYRNAFRQGRAHHLPGQVLPAQPDWFMQWVMFPFMLMYGAPVALLVPVTIGQTLDDPASWGRMAQRIMRMDLGEQLLMTGLILLLVLLLGYHAAQAWHLAQSFGRTWQVRRLRRRGACGYGLVLLPDAIVGRLIDNQDWRHNCLWIPREAVVQVAWQKVKEEGAKRSHWVYRTRLCYRLTGQRANPKHDRHRWLTLPGNLVQFSEVHTTALAQSPPQTEARRPTASLYSREEDWLLFQTLLVWWQQE